MYLSCVCPVQAFCNCYFIFILLSSLINSRAPAFFPKKQTNKQTAAAGHQTVLHYGNNQAQGGQWHMVTHTGVYGPQGDNEKMQFLAEIREVKQHGKKLESS